MLTGQAKKDYQREYMRNRRGTVRPTLDPPVMLDPVTGNTVRPVKTQDDIVKTQSTNPMKVGYARPNH